MIILYNSIFNNCIWFSKVYLFILLGPNINSILPCTLLAMIPCKVYWHWFWVKNKSYTPHPFNSPHPRLPHVKNCITRGLSERKYGNNNKLLRFCCFHIYILFCLCQLLLLGLSSIVNIFVCVCYLVVADSLVMPLCWNICILSCVHKLFSPNQ